MLTKYYIKKITENDLKWYNAIVHKANCDYR